jgi:perosamine synthetase
MFETTLENSLGLKKNSVVTVNSGTSALHLAIEALGLHGDILLPANTFVATGLAILYAKCNPIFCDILPDGTIDPEDVDRKITRDTVAVMAVNWAGKSCRITELETLCHDNHLALIVDAAQSFGMGFGGDITCLSFQATKHLTTGDGGALVCKNITDYERAKSLRWFGINRNKGTTGPLGERMYNLQEVGFKYHMNDFAASLGLANLQGIEDRLEHYRNIAEIYQENLKSVTPVHKDYKDNAFWAFPVRVDNVIRFADFCRVRHVPCSIIHRGIDHNIIFGGVDCDLTEQRKWEQTVTHFPIHMDITEAEALWICNEVNQYV